MGYGWRISESGLYTVSEALLYRSELHRIIGDLIHEQRTFLTSTNPVQRSGVLWTAADLDKRLRQCTDREIGTLLTIVGDQFHIFEPDRKSTRLNSSHLG